MWTLAARRRRVMAPASPAWRPVTRRGVVWLAAVSAVGLVAVASAQESRPPAPPKVAVPRKDARASPWVPGPAFVLEPKAIDLLKAASQRLAGARSMTFTAVVTYESPSRLGPALAYTTRSEVTVQRPDKFKVITSADGPASEFSCDGKTMMAYAPAEKLVAVAPAPPTIDAALKAAYDMAALYFPFSDLIVADPYADIAGHIKLAFYIGQSRVVADTVTDMVA